MPPRPEYDRRWLAGRETRATPPAAAFGHVAGGTVLVLSYLALIPGLLPAFILAGVLGLVLLVPVLAIAVASCLLLLPILALRRLARRGRHSSVTGDSGAKREGPRPATRVAVVCSAVLGGEDAALRTAMFKQIHEIGSLPEVVSPPRSTKPNPDQDDTER